MDTAVGSSLRPSRVYVYGKGVIIMEDRTLIEEIEKLDNELHNEHDAATVNTYIDRFERLLGEAKAKWPNIGRLTIIPRARRVGENEAHTEATTQMGILKSGVSQLHIMARRKAA